MTTSQKLKEGYLDLSRSYDYNKKSFKFGDPGNLLLTLYCKLICLELFLKERIPNFNDHNVPDKLVEFTSNHSPTITIGVNLGSELRKLYCSDKFNPLTGRNVPQNSYPHMRYLRHESDFPAGTTQVSSDEDLKQCLTLVDQIYKVLKQNGYQV